MTLTTTYTLNGLLSKRDPQQLSPAPAATAAKAESSSSMRSAAAAELPLPWCKKNEK